MAFVGKGDIFVDHSCTVTGPVLTSLLPACACCAALALDTLGAGRVVAVVQGAQNKVLERNTAKA